MHDAATIDGRLLSSARCRQRWRWWRQCGGQTSALSSVPRSPMRQHSRSDGSADDGALASSAVPRSRDDGLSLLIRAMMMMTTVAESAWTTVSRLCQPSLSHPCDDGRRCLSIVGCPSLARAPTTTMAAAAQTTMPRHRLLSRGIRHCGAAFVVDNDDEIVKMWMWGV